MLSHLLWLRTSLANQAGAEPRAPPREYNAARWEAVHALLLASIIQPAERQSCNRADEHDPGQFGAESKTF